MKTKLEGIPVPDISSDEFKELKHMATATKRTKTAKVATKAAPAKSKARAKRATIPATLARRAHEQEPRWSPRITVYLMGESDLREYRAMKEFSETNTARESFVVDGYRLTEIGSLRTPQDGPRRVVEVVVAEKQKVSYQLGMPVALKTKPNEIAGLFSHYKGESIAVAVRAFVLDGKLKPFPGDNTIDLRVYDPADVVPFASPD